jgi:hypothetical protein
MIVTQGGRFGSYGFYVLNRKPAFVYNFLDLQRVRWESADCAAAPVSDPATPRAAPSLPSRSTTLRLV